MGRGHGQRVGGIGAAQAAGVGCVHDGRAAHHARDRQAAAQALGHGDQVGLHAVVLHGEQLARASEAGLHLVGDQQHAVLVAQLAQAGEQGGRHGVKAPFALDGLHDDGGHALRVHRGLEQHGNGVQRLLHAHAGLLAGEGRVEDFARHGAEALLVGRHLARQCHAQLGAAMEGALEGDHGRASRGMARDLDGVLHGLGARGEEGGLGRAGDGRQRIDALGQRNRAFVGNDLEGRVREALQLLLHGLDHARMAMARVEHGNAGREIDVLPALGIGQQGVVGLHGMEAAHHTHAARHGGVAPVLELLVRGRGGGAGHERVLR